jgi:hypothetical protein
VSGAHSQASGGCHCGNLRLQLQLTGAPGEYRPRACDCQFCRKHGAAWVSDPQGSLRIGVRDQRELGRYQQGSGTAELLLCRRCGVLVGACYDDAGRLYGVANAKVIDDGTSFGAEQVVSPQQLTAADKTRRWRELWFPEVSIIDATSA